MSIVHRLAPARAEWHLFSRSNRRAQRTTCSPSPRWAASGCPCPKGQERASGIRRLGPTCSAARPGGYADLPEQARATSIQGDPLGRGSDSGGVSIHFASLMLLSSLPPHIPTISGHKKSQKIFCELMGDPDHPVKCTVNGFQLVPNTYFVHFSRAFSINRRQSGAPPRR